MLGTKAVGQLSGPAGFLAGVVLKIVMWLLDYLKVKHDFKRQSEDQLKAYEEALAKTDLTEEQKDAARKDFLK